MRLHEVQRVPKGVRKQTTFNLLLYFKMATWKGLEPSTSAVTGRHSNQLNYQAVST
jgi:hypothetical protein